MVQFTKFPFNIRLIKSCELLACRLMKYSLAFLNVYYSVFNKFSVEGLHIGKNCEFANCGGVSNVKSLVF